MRDRRAALLRNNHQALESMRSRCKAGPFFVGGRQNSATSPFEMPMCTLGKAVGIAHPTTAATLMWWVKVFGVPPSGGPGPRKRGTPNGYRLYAGH